MPRPCLACHHREHEDINAELVRGTPRMTVARVFGLSETAVRRHYHLHLPETLRIEAEADRQRASRELWAILRATTTEVRRQAERARDLRRRRAYFRAVRLLYPLIELQVRVLGRGE